jgi:predicted CoA-substrate-specific enzyme activase
MNNIFKTGIDIGSTTMKIIVLNEQNEIFYKNYVRHKADINGTLSSELDKLNSKLAPNSKLSINITGSAGMGVAERTQIPFVQEVIAAIKVIKTHYPDTHTLIDLGGEDAKIVFFEDEKQPDIRMNGSCAGGTGAFIDQMADLMNITVANMDKVTLGSKKIYPIASRCGVFAKTDVQNLISRNIPQADLAMSILHTVALQAVTTLIRGHKVMPKIICTGGPLTFIPALRKSFANVLKIPENELLLPENSEFFPAWGCALLS